MEPDQELTTLFHISDPPTATTTRWRFCSGGCDRPINVCLGDKIPTEPISTFTQVVILHHPHEQRHKLATVPVLSKCLRNCQTLIGRRLRLGDSPFLDSLYNAAVENPSQPFHALYLFPEMKTNDSELQVGGGQVFTGILGSLKTVEVLDTPHSGINGLVSSFVKLLQEENASRECTTVRMAGKLTPFDFNRMPESDDLNCCLASQKPQKKYNLKLNESLAPESFCPICSSPLSKSDLLNLNDVEKGQLIAEAFGAKCCLSCQFQILRKEPSSVEHFYSLLPQPIIALAKNENDCNRKWLREQIRDCLLSPFRLRRRNLNLLFAHFQY